MVLNYDRSKDSIELSPNTISQFLSRTYVPGDFLAMSAKDLVAFSVTIDDQTLNYEEMCDKLHIRRDSSYHRMSRFEVVEKVWPGLLKREQFETQPSKNQLLWVKSDILYSYRSVEDFVDAILRNFENIGRMKISSQRNTTVYRLRNIADIVLGTDPMSKPKPHVQQNVSLQSLEKVIDVIWGDGEPVLEEGEHILYSRMKTHTAKIFVDATMDPVEFLNSYMLSDIPLLQGYSLSYIGQLYGYAKPVRQPKHVLEFMAAMLPDETDVARLVEYSQNKELLLKDYQSGTAPASKLTPHSVAVLLKMYKINGVNHKVLSERIRDRIEKLGITA